MIYFPILLECYSKYGSVEKSRERIMAYSGASISRADTQEVF